MTRHLALAALLLASSTTLADSRSDDLDRVATVALTDQLCGYDAEDELRVLVIRMAAARGISEDAVIRMAVVRARQLLRRATLAGSREFCLRMRSIVR